MPSLLTIWPLNKSTAMLLARENISQYQTRCITSHYTFSLSKGVVRFTQYHFGLDIYTTRAYKRDCVSGFADQQTTASSSGERAGSFAPRLCYAARKERWSSNCHVRSRHAHKPSEHLDAKVLVRGIPLHRATACEMCIIHVLHRGCLRG